MRLNPFECLLYAATAVVAGVMLVSGCLAIWGE